MPFFSMQQMTTRELAPGVEVKAFSGEKMTMTLFSMAAGAAIPAHAHPHEQMGTVLKGSVELILGEEKRTVAKGDCWLIPANMVHSGHALDEPSEVLEFFSPPREDYAASIRYTAS
jgi:quercetin dioxygenase-like cupin family protein